MGLCLPLFWTLCDPPHGFQSQGGSLICLHVMNLRVTSGATPDFSTNMGAGHQVIGMVKKIGK